MIKSAKLNMSEMRHSIYPDSALDTLNCATQKEVLPCVATENALYTATGRVYSIIKDALSFSIQEHQSHKKDYSGMETMSYTAWEPSAGTDKGMDHMVNRTCNRGTHDFYHIPYHPAFGTSTAFLADTPLYNGNDPTSAPHTAIFGDIPVFEYPDTIQKTFIKINYEVNAGSKKLKTYYWPENIFANVVLLKFDRGQVPEDAQIQGTHLKQYQTAVGEDDSYGASVHKVINHNPDFNQFFRTIAAKVPAQRLSTLEIIFYGEN